MRTINLNIYRNKVNEVVALYNKYSNKHLEYLINKLSNKYIDIEGVIIYGMKYLPDLLNDKGNIDLDNLEGYKPEVVEYFTLLSELDFLKKDICDFCLNLAIYANGESMQINNNVYSFKPLEEFGKIFGDYVLTDVKFDLLIKTEEDEFLKDKSNFDKFIKACLKAIEIRDSSPDEFSIEFVSYRITGYCFFMFQDDRVDHILDIAAELEISRAKKYTRGEQEEMWIQLKKIVVDSFIK